MSSFELTLGGYQSRWLADVSYNWLLMPHFALCVGAWVTAECAYVCTVYLHTSVLGMHVQACVKSHLSVLDPSLAILDPSLAIPQWLNAEFGSVLPHPPSPSYSLYTARIPGQCYHVVCVSVPRWSHRRPRHWKMWNLWVLPDTIHRHIHIHEQCTLAW